MALAKSARAGGAAITAVLLLGSVAEAGGGAGSGMMVSTGMAAMMDADAGSDHSAIPAGVHGAGMVAAGRVMLTYSPMFMHMDDNFIGSSTVPPETIVTTVPSNTVTGNAMGMGKSMVAPMREDYRIVPSSMDVQSHMLHAMVGVTDWLNLMVMGSYQRKSMTMTSFAGSSGTRILGSSTSSDDGFGDTSVVTLWRLYQSNSQHVHLNLGLSLPSGSITQTMTMLSPMGMRMTMRGSYGMQLGSGTVDLLPGLSYTGRAHRWSWGAAWRSRIPLDDNSKGYHYGALHQLTGWAGYSWFPGITTTARAEGEIQARISGSDPMIGGLMQGTNPRFYGGRRINLLGGVEIAGRPFGLGATHLAVEAGGPVYQHLNGPQLGTAWQVDAVLSAGF